MSGQFYYDPLNAGDEIKHGKQKEKQEKPNVPYEDAVLFNPLDAATGADPAISALKARENQAASWERKNFKPNKRGSWLKELGCAAVIGVPSVAVIGSYVYNPTFHNLVNNALHSMTAFMGR